jgi:hypothetical protein
MPIISLNSGPRGIFSKVGVMIGECFLMLVDEGIRATMISLSFPTCSSFDIPANSSVST